MSVPLIEIDSVSKSFWIPDEPRHTVREHVMAGFMPRPRRRLPVLDSVLGELPNLLQQMRQEFSGNRAAIGGQQCV